MLTVAKALQQVLEQARPLAPVTLARDETLGLVLAEEVTSDIDSPPHDKSIVDGYAICASDLSSGKAELTLLEEVTAGMVPTQEVRLGTTTRIMTGAPLPAGADAVVMIERSELSTSGAQSRVTLDDPRVKLGQNIVRRGSSIRRGDRVLERGTQLDPVAIGVLAEVGRAQVQVIPAPRVAVLATGNELVVPEQIPDPGQIRNSNESLLLACARGGGHPALGLGIARDDRESLRERISAGLEADVLLLSGGVSAGVLDLVPGVLAELGVQQVFHKVQLKPGKPIWFGVSSRGSQRTLVFGLPGNPVSGLVCFELFVREALYALRGIDRTTSNIAPRTSVAKLGTEFIQRGDRPCYHPGTIRYSQGETIVTPLRSSGSGDLRSMIAATVLIIFPPGDRTFATGEIVECMYRSGIH